MYDRVDKVTSIADDVRGLELSPEEVPLHALVDVDELLSNYKQLTKRLGGAMSAVLFDEKRASPLAEGREILWRAPDTRVCLGSADNVCVERHWQSALTAMKSGKPHEKFCTCGSVLLSCPVLLEYRDRVRPKACVTFAMSRENFRNPIATTEAARSKASGDGARTLGQQAFQIPPLIRETLIGLVEATSSQVSANYACYCVSTKCHIAEESLNLEREKVDAIISGLGATGSIIDRDMTIKWVNSTLGRGAGGRSKLVGRKCYAVYRSRDCVCDNCPVVGTFTTGLPQVAVREIYDDGGERRVVRLTTIPMPDASGVTKEALELSQDVTAHVKTAENVSRWRKLLDNVSDIVMMTDHRGQILAANHRARQILGYSEEELLSVTAMQLCVDDRLLRRLGDEAREAGSSVGEIRMLTKKGSEIATELSITFSPTDKTFQGVIRDITERRNLQEDLRKRADRLEAQHKKLLTATEHKSKFFTNMSHELRTPLTSVVGFTELLLDDIEDPVSPGQRELLLKVSQNSHRLLGIINDLLDLSRAESGRVAVRTVEVDLSRLIEQIVSNMKPLAKDKDLDLVVTPVSGPLMVYADEQKLSQILVNLISNAIKFTPSGQVIINARANNGEMEISIEDTGIGIAKTDIPMIFEEFRTGTESVRHKIPGTGLGLAIAKKLCELLGGRVTVVSELGKGTTFTVTLPNCRGVEG